MKESAFLKQNSNKWKAIENPDQKNPDLMAEYFIQLTDDLSYSKTFFPNSRTTTYLNAVTLKYYNLIYANKKVSKSRIFTFWTTELPCLFFQSQTKLLYSFLFFMSFCVLGWFSAAYDEDFVRLILGNEYVDMTLDNIKKGDPMAVYKSNSSSDMFLSITTNNIKVSFFTFIAGVFCGMGTIYLLFNNGIMLGSFQYFFYQKGLLSQSALAIWIHGTLEISAIVIAGCAGLVMGNSILFPKTYNRGHSFREGAKQGLKITVGLIPIFVIAGFLESFVTRLKLDLTVNLLIIISSLVAILWYFVYYPIQLNKKEKNKF